VASSGETSADRPRSFNCSEKLTSRERCRLTRDPAFGDHCSPKSTGHEASAASFHHGVCRCPDCKLGYPRFLSKARRVLKGALQASPRCRRVSTVGAAASVSAKFREHEIERDADALGRSLVGRKRGGGARTGRSTMRARLRGWATGQALAVMRLSLCRSTASNRTRVAGPGKTSAGAALGYGDIVDNRSG